MPSPSQPPASPSALFISNALSLGGAERSLLTVLRGAATAAPRWRVALLCRPGSALSRAARPLPIRVLERPLLQLRFARHPLRYASALRHTLAGARAVAADVIVADGWRAVPLAVPVARLLRRPVHVHLREIDAPRSTLNRRLLRLAHSVTAISQAHRRFLLAQNLIPAERLHLVYNGIEPEAYRRDGPPPPPLRAELGLGPDELGVVLPGNLIRVKGGTSFLALARRLATTHPRARFYFAGDAMADPADPRDRGFADELRTAAADLGDRVRFLGHRTDMADVFWAMDLVVLPTHYEEAFGRVAVEAMLAGRAIAAYRSGALPEIIRHEETGLVVDKHDLESLTAAVARLLDDDVLRQRFGEAGRSRALNQFPASAKVTGMWTVFERLLLA